MEIIAVFSIRFIALDKVQYICKLILFKCWDQRMEICAMTLHNAHDNAVTCLRFDNERIVSGSVDRTIKVRFFDFFADHLMANQC